MRARGSRMEADPSLLLTYVSNQPRATEWLNLQVALQRTPNTVAAYGRGLDDYLSFCSRIGIDPERASRSDVATYVQDLTVRPPARGRSAVGFSNATLCQRLTIIRLFDEHLRNRLMLALAYDAALRREELCLLQTGDFDPAHRTLTLRAETTKTKRARCLPYSAAAAELFAAYLPERRALATTRGPLFLSTSTRNRATPISKWSWSKIVRALGLRAGVPKLTTHSFRHLCLTDLARAGWDIHEIASFAGHRSLQSTLLYIHLSARDLAGKFARGMAAIHDERMALLLDRLS